MSQPDDEHQRLEEIAESFSTHAGKDVNIVHYTARAVVSRCRGGRVLEVGCADGAISVRLAAAFDDLWLLDGSQRLLERALELASKARGIHSLIEDYEPEAPFDAVIACHILEHVREPVEVLRRMGSWLAPGGELHVVVPNAESINRRIGMKLEMLETIDQLTEPDFAVGHRRIYRERTLDADVAAAGLQIVEKRGILLKPLSNAQMLSWRRDLLDAFYELGFEMPVAMCSELYYVLAV
ncbi:MAG: class I SAM-dependent methyltransferase [bacterium]|nr:class I SAM-dependent methyltransferase [bacterium]